MRIPSHFDECTAFLCEENGGRPDGTAFFVEMEEAGQVWVYLVTARHCVEAVTGHNIYVRVNTPPGDNRSTGIEDLCTRKDDWFKHEGADVAAIVSPITRHTYPIQQIPLDLSIDGHDRFDLSHLAGRGNPVLEPMLRQNFPEGIAVEVGDELFSPGLFVQSAGTNRNLPVVRFGNIARMPGDEMITLSTLARGDISIRAYLAETHSWGGYSGSPMFWHYQYNIQLPINAQRWAGQAPALLTTPQPIPEAERIDVMVSRGWAIALLGLVSGHYDIPIRARNEEIEMALNAGIAVITPAENIRELLMSEEMVRDRSARAVRGAS